MGSLAQRSMWRSLILIFPRADVNADGVLGKDEFSAAAFAYADLDHDNQLTAAEYEDFYRKQFQRRDANGDEVLTLDEM